VAKRHYSNSAHTLIKNWNTPILITHGEMDYRVPVDQGMAAFNAAQMHGVESKLLLFPEENHWILKPQNSIHWNREFFGWLDKYCKE
ncbi:MAG: prolyl oligopeptidase family serine peptidase, partial [Bacteroidia bacterium]|nr:prolyl oligopeptidase family serine peptidase [Bacteroidia bacterium]